MPDDKEDTDMDVVRKARSQLESERVSIDNLIGFLNMIKEEMHLKEQDIEQRAQDLEGLYSKLAEYDSQVDKTTEEIQRCENTIEISQGELEKKNHGMIDVEGEIKDAVENLERKKEETEQSKAAYSAKKDAERTKKKEEIEEKDDDIAAKEFEISALTRQIQALEKERDNLKSEVQTLENDKTAYQSQIAEIDKDEHDHIKEFDAHYAAEQEKTKRRLSKLGDDKGNIEDIITTLTGALKSEHEKRSKLAEQLAEYKQERTEVREEVYKKEEELENLRKEMEDRSVIKRVKAASRSSTELYEMPEEPAEQLPELEPAPADYRQDEIYPEHLGDKKKEDSIDSAEELPDLDILEPEEAPELTANMLSKVQKPVKPIDPNEHYIMGLNVDSVTDGEVDKMLDAAFEPADEPSVFDDPKPVEAVAAEDALEAAAANGAAKTAEEDADEGHDELIAELEAIDGLAPEQPPAGDETVGFAKMQLAQKKDKIKKEASRPDVPSAVEEKVNISKDDVRLVESPLEEVLDGEWKYKSESGIKKGVLYCRPAYKEDSDFIIIEYIDGQSMIGVLRSSAYQMLSVAQNEFNDKRVTLDKSKIEQLSKKSEAFKNSYEVFTGTLKAFVNGYNDSINIVLSIYADKGGKVDKKHVDAAELESGKWTVSHPELIRKLKDVVLPAILPRHKINSMFSNALQGIDAEFDLLDEIKLNSVVESLDDTEKYMSLYQTPEDTKNNIEGIEYLLDKRGYAAIDMPKE